MTLKQIVRRQCAHASRVQVARWAAEQRRRNGQDRRVFARGQAVR